MADRRFCRTISAWRTWTSCPLPPSAATRPARCSSRMWRRCPSCRRPAPFSCRRVSRANRGWCHNAIIWLACTAYADARLRTRPQGHTSVRRPRATATVISWSSRWGVSTSGCSDLLGMSSLTSVRVTRPAWGSQLYMPVGGPSRSRVPWSYTHWPLRLQRCLLSGHAAD